MANFPKQKDLKIKLAILNCIGNALTAQDATVLERLESGVGPELRKAAAEASYTFWLSRRLELPLSVRTRMDARFLPVAKREGISVPPI